MDDEDVFADVSGQCVFAGQGTHRTVEYYVRWDQSSHRLDVVGVAIQRTLVPFVIAVFVFGQVVVLLADVVGTVVFDLFTVAVSQSVARQDHDGTIHAVYRRATAPSSHRVRSGR